MIDPSMKKPSLKFINR